MTSLLCTTFLRRRPSLPDPDELKCNDSTSTLVEDSALSWSPGKKPETKADTGSRLVEIRKLMEKEGVDYYVVPTEDAHASEYVPASEKRREWLSGFTGSAGQAIVTPSDAYLIADSRYWIQAEQQLDDNWTLVRAGESPQAPQNWVQWIVSAAHDAKVGIDARLISHSLALSLDAQLGANESKLVYPDHNLVDAIWNSRPSPSKDYVYIQPIEYTGTDVTTKIANLRKWLATYPGDAGTILSALPSIAYLLNLRGNDIAFNPLFVSYLYVNAAHAILFIDQEKINKEVSKYLNDVPVEVRPYDDVWKFLGSDEMGKGKVLINGATSQAITAQLPDRFTVAVDYVENTKAVKNETELAGFRKAYTRDSAAYVRWLAWLQERIDSRREINEWDAAEQLTAFRKENELFMGLAYDNISASGPNAALPHYQPSAQSSRVIDRATPYLNDSGAQYRDGTIDTTRTMHFGHPTKEQCEAFTRVLQGHIAIDSAVFPEGTNGTTLDGFARRALWQDGLNYGHGTGHGFGSFLTVHEGPPGFGPLVPGHVITNEPGFYNSGKFGMRIESALIVQRVQTKRAFGGDVWLGFERLTCVPIQTKMVLKHMLSKEELSWIKDHNRSCLEKLEPLLQHDRRALKWLKREAKRGLGPCSDWLPFSL